MTIADAIRRAVECFRPDPVLTPDAWADAHYRLGTGESAQPGRWVTRAYQREPLRALGAYDPTRRVVLMWPAQASGKSAIGLIWAGYTASVSPCPMLLVQPREIDAEDFSKTRLAPMAALPVLAGRIADPKSRDSGNTILLRSFPGGSWRLTASNSPAGFRGKPIARLWFDEPDGYPASAGTEGPPVKLGRARLSSWGPRAKELMTCTPTVKGASRIEEEYILSSQGEWQVPCPHCGEMQPLVWSGMKWDGTPGLPGFSVWYECAACSARIDEHQKTAIIDRGRWIHARPERLGDTWGGHMTAIATPYGGLEWRTLVEEWLHATARAKVGDTMPLRAFINVRLAETWEDRGEQVDQVSIESRLEPAWDRLPLGVRVLTAATDVQDDRLHAHIWGWGVGHESWLVARIIIPTDPADQGTMRAHDLAVLVPTWEREDGAHLRVVSAAMDCGGHRSDDVLRYCAAKDRRRVMFAVRGSTSPADPIYTPKARRAERGNRAYQFWRVGHTTSADDLFRRLRVRRDDLGAAGPGYVHLAEGLDPDFFEQITAEKLETRHNRVTKRAERRYVLRVEGRANEDFDCARYAMAALLRWETAGGRVTLAHADETAEQTPPEMSSTEAKPAVDFPAEQGQPVAESVAPSDARPRRQRRTMSAEEYRRMMRG